MRIFSLYHLHTLGTVIFWLTSALKNFSHTYLGMIVIASETKPHVTSSLEMTFIIGALIPSCVDASPLRNPRSSSMIATMAHVEGTYQACLQPKQSYVQVTFFLPYFIIFSTSLKVVKNANYTPIRLEQHLPSYTWSSRWDPFLNRGINFMT
jgi:hypothetical protein